MPLQIFVHGGAEVVEAADLGKPLASLQVGVVRDAHDDRVGSLVSELANEPLGHAHVAIDVWEYHQPVLALLIVHSQSSKVGSRPSMVGKKLQRRLVPPACGSG